jgi:serine/threonine-protein kinase
MQMEGKKLGGRYEILSRIGGGGMAVVYKAIDHLLNRHVAIKVLSESLSNDSEFIRRFTREAQAAASLSHQNIVNVYDVGRDGYTQYIVMELVEGITLKDHILENGPLPVAEAAEIAIQICEGLAQAHENQIVHRDIKPHNILLGHNGRVKITDFGIARAASSSTITQTGSVMGSVHYFSPEQARGGVVGEKSDIYSLGIVLYEMLTGELPFDGDAAISIALKHLQDPVPDPRELNPDIDENMYRIITRALEKDANMRYTSVKAMMQDIRFAASVDNQWSNKNKQQEFFQTIPLSLDDDTDVETEADNPVHTTSATNSNERSSSFYRNAFKRDDEQEEPEKNKVGDQTMLNLERLRRVPSDKDKTVFERTVIYLDNLQARLPWWQKALFFVFTIAVIIALSVWGLNMIWGLFTSGEEDPVANNYQQQQQEQEVTIKNFEGTKLNEAKSWLKEKGISQDQIKVVYKKKDGYDNDVVFDQEPKANKKLEPGTTVTLYVNSSGELDFGTKFPVENFVGMWQSRAEELARQYEGKKYRIDVTGNRCWKSDTIPQGQIMAQDPKPGTMLTKNDTVKLWVSVKHDRCSTPPPS